jgi:hypothetical protein
MPVSVPKHAASTLESSIKVPEDDPAYPSDIGGWQLGDLDPRDLSKRSRIAAKRGYAAVTRLLAIVLIPESEIRRRLGHEIAAGFQPA